MDIKKKISDEKIKKSTGGVQFDSDQCVGCGLCVEVCPVGAITIRDRAEIDKDACVECWACTGVCPQGAIQQ